MIYDQQQLGHSVSMENGSLREFAKLLILGAAALRSLVGKHPESGPVIAESLDKVLEIASTLDAIGETLRGKVSSSNVWPNSSDPSH